MVKEKSLQQIVAGATGDLHAKECIKKKHIKKTQNGSTIHM